MSALPMPTKIYDWVESKFWNDEMSDVEKTTMLNTFYESKVHEYDLLSALRAEIENGDISLPDGCSVDDVLNKEGTACTNFFDTETKRIFEEKVEADPELSDWPAREWDYT